MFLEAFHNLLAIISRGQIKQIMRLIILMISLAIIETSSIVSVMPFLAIISSIESIESNRYLSSLYLFLKQYGVNSTADLIFVLGLFSLVAIVFAGVFRTYVNAKIFNFIEESRFLISTELYKKYLKQGYYFFIKRHSSELIKTTISEVDQVCIGFFRPTLQMISQIFVVTAIISILLYVDWRIALLSSGAITLMYGLIFLLVKKKIQKVGSIVVDENKNRFRFLSESFSSIKFIKASNKEEQFVANYSKSMSRMTKNQGKYLTLNVLQHSLVEIAIFGSFILVLLYLLSKSGIDSFISGEMIPVFVLYALAAYRIKPGMQTIFTGLSNMIFGFKALENLAMDYKTLKYAERNIAKECVDFTNGISIKLKNISFRYSLDDPFVLKNVNLEIKSGSYIGFIGKSGSGKSTLVDIILGLLTPESGEIFFNNVKLTKENISLIQKNIGYVSQDIILLDATIEQNIAFDLGKEKINHKKVISCAQVASIEDYIINDLKDGYETIVGERGVRLSGGQRQRLAIARALYNDPKLIIFDEATSSLDTETEKKIIALVEQAFKSKTILSISHRPTTLKHADNIYKINNCSLETINKQ